MVDKIFALLSAEPLVSIILGFLLAVFLIFILQDEIKAWVKKRYNLYDEIEIKEAFDKASDERVFYSKTSEKLTPSVQDRVLTFLKNKK